MNRHDPPPSLPDLTPDQFRDVFSRIEASIHEVVVGMDDVVRGCLMGLVAGGNVLLEGVPGLGKTLLVKSVGDALSLSFARIQFTPDLMPADITGTKLVVEDEHGGKRFELHRGPVFHHVVLADEVNRATPKTQSAMLEAMQERQVTILGETLKLPSPFFVVATQNPLEMDGTYPLPEAQLDRFFFKLQVEFPSLDDLRTILDRTTRRDTPEVQPVCDGPTLLAMGKLARDVMVKQAVTDYAIRLVLATHPEIDGAPEITSRYVRYGASPRGAQALLLAAKIRALLEGRANASHDDIAAIARPALRHRVILNFEGEAEGIPSDHVVEQILKAVPR
ncbi:MAG: MoxR family ATPase [Deltaproteobacteria bacterium]|nr:MoxR family ATPase [Deltaproteobacteria bacterium]